MRILRTLLLAVFTLCTVAVSAQVTETHGFMGIVPGLYSDPWTGKGAPIEQILDNTPAAAAGMLRGDVIISINGKAVNNGRDIMAIIANLPIGQNISVTYIHKGEEKTAEIALAAKGTKSTYDYTVVRSVVAGKVWWTFQDDNTRVHIVDVNNVEIIREVGNASVELRYNRAEFNELIKSEVDAYEKMKDKLEVVNKLLERQASGNMIAFDDKYAVKKIRFIRYIEQNKTVKEEVSMSNEDASSLAPLKLNELNVYPSPSTGAFTLRLSTELSGTLSVSIKDLSGKEVLTFAQANFSGSFKKEMDMSNYAAGVYYISATIANKTFNSEVVISK